MSEFCLDCVNKHFMDNGNELLIKDVVTEVDLCEGCGQIKPCVIKVRRMARYKLYSGTRQAGHFRTLSDTFGHLQTTELHQM